MRDDGRCDQAFDLSPLSLAIGLGSPALSHFAIKVATAG
jgi:hypothetical protein